MELWQWLILASMFGIGGVFGFVYGRSKADDYTKARQLEQSLNDTKQEFEHYREDVSSHFSKTADLFNQMTADYKAVFEHLATGSEALCGDRVAKLTAEVPTASLTEAAPSPAETAKPSATTEKAAVAETQTTPAASEEETPPAAAEEPSKSTIEKAVESQTAVDATEEKQAATKTDDDDSEGPIASGKATGDEKAEPRTLH